MKIYQITSDTTKIPLAEIRTDGNAVHFIVDNTDGMLPADVKNSFERLKQIVKTSHHLKIQEPELPTTNLLRYVLSDGNVVEITTDGKTCMLNGKIIDDKQKKSFSMQFAPANYMSLLAHLPRFRYYHRLNALPHQLKPIFLRVLLEH